MRSGCSLVILAGGLSRRMGRDKATLPAGDGTLIEHLARRLAPVVDEIIIAEAPSWQQQLLERARDGKSPRFTVKLVPSLYETAIGCFQRGATASRSAIVM